MDDPHNPYRSHDQSDYGSQRQDAQPVQYRLVTLAEYSAEHKAQIRKVALEAEGIQAFIDGGYTITSAWGFQNSPVGVKLQVQETDVARAIEVLSQAEGLPRESYLAAHQGPTPGSILRATIFVLIVIGVLALIMLKNL